MLTADPPAYPPEAALDGILARADAYRLLGAAFRDPDGPFEAPLEVEDLTASLATFGLLLTAGERATLDAVTSRHARAAEHRRLFGHTVAHGCPPYETEYGRRHVFGQAQELADLAGFYAAFGLRPAPSGERPDHVACELEFLAILALKEAYARARGDDALSHVARDGATAFLRDHLGRWAPAFATLAAERAPGSGYAVLAALMSRLVADHAAELGVAPDRLQPGDLRPIEAEPDGFAFACGVDEADPAISG